MVFVFTRVRHRLCGWECAPINKTVSWMSRGHALVSWSVFLRRTSRLLTSTSERFKQERKTAEIKRLHAPYAWRPAAMIVWYYLMMKVVLLLIERWSSNARNLTCLLACCNGACPKITQTNQGHKDCHGVTDQISKLPWSGSKGSFASFLRRCENLFCL